MTRLEPSARRRPTRSNSDIERAWLALWSMPRSSSYAVLGLALAFAAPAGLLVAQAMAARKLPSPDWVVANIERLLVAYSYVTLSTMAVFAILGWALGRSFDRVRWLSITDPLTGVFNRRHFAQRMAEEVNRGRRHGHATAVLCVDIDRLKAINDRLGHSAGDRAIVAVCRILSQNVRAVDAVARVGGDEFAVLMPETSASRASALSRRILRDVARHGHAMTGGLAVSIGVTELDANATGEDDVDDALALADAALYRAKAAGGGHVAVAMPEPSALGSSPHVTQMESAQLVGGESGAGAEAVLEPGGERSRTRDVGKLRQYMVEDLQRQTPPD